MNLSLALTEEQSIFKHFSQFEARETMTLFWSENVDTVAHWNLVYSLSQFDENELNSIKSFYKEKGLTPHILSFKRSNIEHLIAEESEYFYSEKKYPNVNTKNSNENIMLVNNLERFCDIIQECFYLDVKTKTYFFEKMKLLSKIKTSCFYVFEKDGVSLGCASTFRTSMGNDFLFNVATLPEAQGQGLATILLETISKTTDQNLLIYSHNSVMREKILPGLGFQSLGKIWIERIE